LMPLFRGYQGYVDDGKQVEICLHEKISLHSWFLLIATKCDEVNRGGTNKVPTTLLHSAVHAWPPYFCICLRPRSRMSTLTPIKLRLSH
jgi:hypothetical protein